MIQSDNYPLSLKEYSIVGEGGVNMKERIKIYIFFNSISFRFEANFYLFISGLFVINR